KGDEQGGRARAAAPARSMSAVIPLLPALSGTFGDAPEVVRVGDRGLSADELLGAATAVADRIAGARMGAVHATARLERVGAVVGALIAGVPIVPMPPDSGPAERGHILRDSGAELVLDTDGAFEDGAFAGDDGLPALPVLPVDPAARSATSYAEPAAESVAMI